MRLLGKYRVPLRGVFYFCTADHPKGGRIIAYIRNGKVRYLGRYATERELWTAWNRLMQELRALNFTIKFPPP